MEKKYFSTPDEVHLELPASLATAILFVEEQLIKHNFQFKPPYTVSRHGGQIRQLLVGSGWELSITPEMWEIKPLV